MTTPLLVLILLGAPSAEPFYVDSEIGVNFPKKIGDFVAAKRRVYSGKGLGYDITYRSSSGATLNFYVFDFGLKYIEDGKSGKGVKMLFDKALEDVRQIEQLDYYKNVKDSQVGEAFSELVTSRFLCRRLTYQVYRDKTDPGREVVSYLLGTGYRRKMLKIRCTNSADGDIEKELNEFLEAVLGLLVDPGRLA